MCLTFLKLFVSFDDAKLGICFFKYKYLAFI
nr:MAG TPA: hypothetical protein [Caudoviricetes sp.]